MTLTFYQVQSKICNIKSTNETGVLNIKLIPILNSCRSPSEWPVNIYTLSRNFLYSWNLHILVEIFGCRTKFSKNFPRILRDNPRKELKDTVHVVTHGRRGSTQSENTKVPRVNFPFQSLLNYALNDEAARIHVNQLRKREISKATNSDSAPFFLFFSFLFSSLALLDHLFCWNDDEDLTRKEILFFINAA